MASPGPANRDCRRDDSQFPNSGQRLGEVWQNPNPDRLVRILFIQFQAAANSFVTLSKMRGWLRLTIPFVRGARTPKGIPVPPPVFTFNAGDSVSACPVVAFGAERLRTVPVVKLDDVKLSAVCVLRLFHVHVWGKAALSKVLEPWRW